MRCGPTRASASCSRMTAMTAPFRYRRLSYVVLDVADIDRSLAFYRDLVGLAVDRRQGDVVYLRCSELPQNLILRRGDTPGLARAAFELERDRKRVGEGKSVAVRVDRGGRGYIKKKK